MSVKLTHKRTSKELETALAVVKCLIGVANNQIKSEPEDRDWETLSYLSGFSCISS